MRGLFRAARCGVARTLTPIDLRRPGWIHFNCRRWLHTGLVHRAGSQLPAKSVRYREISPSMKHLRQTLL